MVERAHLCFRPGSEQAQTLDREDPLRHLRNRFYLHPGQIYLDGNSLGLASRDAEEALLNALESWKSHGIGGWMSGDRPWFFMAEELGNLQAALVGAEPEEVVVTGTTTVNLHALVATFYRPEGKRTKVLADGLNFPSDLYALQSQVRLRGYNPEQDLILVPSHDGRTIREDDIIASMTEEVALILLPSVLYRSGQLLNMEQLAAEAHRRQIPIGFDCSHSAGVIPHQLHDWGVDFAFWCNYKYLNGGPGAVGSLFVHQKHFGRLPGLTGWFGYHKERQFQMLPTFEPAEGAGAWQISTPPVLATAPLYGALRIFQEAGMAAIREKSQRQTAYLIYLIETYLSAPPYNFTIGTPREAARRGGHVALEHPEAVRINAALKALGVVPDFRPPNVIRLAPVPLYNTYTELWQTVEHLRRIIDERLYEQHCGKPGTVA
ncbi:MAG: kynureninase [Bacillota bacterium]